MWPENRKKEKKKRDIYLEKCEERDRERRDKERYMLRDNADFWGENAGILTFINYFL